MKEINEVVVAVDGTDGAIEAAKAAARLANAMEADLTLLYVFPLLPRNLGGVMHVSQEEFDRMRQSAAEQVFDETTGALGNRESRLNREVLVGDPAAEILGYLNDRQDVLAVLGRRGQSKIQALLLGSVSDKVVRHTRTPVTVVG